ncbi:MAG: hypothetical protein GY796_11740 [Chloroflexi bacterium]|nr:hypothetical protein [Chloroflexota bacterium]
MMPCNTHRNDGRYFAAILHIVKPETAASHSRTSLKDDHCHLPETSFLTTQSIP